MHEIWLLSISLTSLIKHTEHQIKGSCWIELRPQAAANECERQMGGKCKFSFYQLRPKQTDAYLYTSDSLTTFAVLFHPTQCFLTPI